MQQPTPLLLPFRRKFIVGACLMVPGALAVLLPESIADRLHVESWQVGIVGLAIFVSVTIWLAYGVQCPACRANLFLHAVGHTKGGNWLHWLLHAESCPKCGYPATSVGNAGT
jgi:hypothetical protein